MLNLNTFVQLELFILETFTSQLISRQLLEKQTKSVSMVLNTGCCQSPLDRLQKQYIISQIEIFDFVIIVAIQILLNEFQI